MKIEGRGESAGCISYTISTREGGGITFRYSWSRTSESQCGISADLIYRGRRVDSVSNCYWERARIPQHTKSNNHEAYYEKSKMGKVRTQGKYQCGISVKPVLGTAPLSGHYPAAVQR